MDFGQVEEIIVNFIKREVEARKSKGVVIGISGGIDSTVLAYLAVKALDKTRVLGIILPDKEVTPLDDVTDGLEVCNRLDIEYKTANINSAKEGFLDVLEHSENNVLLGNLVARIRMCILYYYAGLKGRLVIGSSNKTELLLGYFTKYGDGAADLLPLGELYKTEIIGLGKHLKIPNSILQKKSSARLWTGQVTEEELGLPFSQLDLVIDKLIDSPKKKMQEDMQEYQLGFPEEIDLKSIQKIQNLIITNKHKLTFPPVCNLSTK
jgi:NAD+ synthase